MDYIVKTIIQQSKKKRRDTNYETFQANYVVEKKMAAEHPSSSVTANTGFNGANIELLQERRRQNAAAKLNMNNNIIPANIIPASNNITDDNLEARQLFR